VKKIALSTLGCKVNQYESASILSTLDKERCEIVPFSHQADIYIINTCAVTSRAGQQSRQLIRKALKQNPEARLIVTGCYAQMNSQSILEITDQQACIIGNGYKDLISEGALREEKCDLTMLVGNIAQKKDVCHLPVTDFKDRTRAYLRIQDGCNNFCTYCIVPYTRGRSRSVPLPDLLDQMQTYETNGYREVVITGINVGKYGLDQDGDETIYTLLDRLCRDFPKIRIRLSSVEPTEINESLLQLLEERNNFMPHLHIPLQSGDDEVLSQMNRRYTTQQFREVVLAANKVMPLGSMGCDILGGFPGESEKAHLNTLELLSDLPITYLHVFPYSRRPGTLAASMKDQIPTQIKKERVAALRALDQRKRLDFHKRNKDTVHDVLVERRNRKDKSLQGFSDNYLPVRCQGPSSLIHQVVQVQITDTNNDYVQGVLIEK